MTSMRAATSGRLTRVGMEFRAMEQDPEIFLHPRIESGGYGVVWTDELDVVSEEIWDNGMAVIR